MDAEWRFEISYFKGDFSAYLRKMTPWNGLNPFEVTTWLDDQRSIRKHIKCIRMEVKCAYERLWDIREIDLLRAIPASRDDGDITIVCMLLHTGSALQRETKHQSIQASLELPTDLEELSLDLSTLMEQSVVPDVELKCGDSIVPAHRAVLAARSDYFSTVFQSNKDERRTVEVPDVNLQVLHLLLRYMYCGKIPYVSQNLLPELYAAAEKYAFPRLKKACSDYMSRGLTEENCLFYLEFADAHNEVDFLDEIFLFISKNKRVMESESWNAFTDKHSELAVKVYRISFEKWFSV